MRHLLRPVLDRVVIRPMEPDALEDKSGEKKLIEVVQTAKERPMVGQVLAVGPKVSQVTSRDTVVYGKYSGNEITLNGEQLLILKEAEIFSVVVSE